MSLSTAFKSGISALLSKADGSKTYWYASWAIVVVAAAVCPRWVGVVMVALLYGSHAYQGVQRISATKKD